MAKKRNSHPHKRNKSQIRRKALERVASFKSIGLYRHRSLLARKETPMHTVGCAQVISPSHMEVTTMLNGMLRVQCISKDLKDSSGSSSIGSFFRENTTTHTREVTLAEVRMVQFIARHNISFQAADHLSQLFPILFPDSKIACS